MLSDTQVWVHLRRRIHLLWLFQTSLFQAHAVTATIRRSGRSDTGYKTGMFTATAALLALSSAQPPSRTPDDEDWDMVLDWALCCGLATAAAAASGGAGRRGETGGGRNTTSAKWEIPSQQEALMSSSTLVIFCWYSEEKFVSKKKDDGMSIAVGQVALVLCMLMCHWPLAFIDRRRPVSGAVSH